MNEHEPRLLADIHNHLVPGVDDGARSLSESLAHLRELRAQGVVELATSSHLSGRLVYEDGAFAARLRRLELGWADLERACAGRDDVPRLFFSQEILTPTPDVAGKVFGSSPAAGAGAASGAPAGDPPGPGLRGTDYALCEFGFDLEGEPLDVVRTVLALGKRMIVAHPERYRRGGQPVGIEEVRSWKEAGALLQVNCGSLLGHHGPGHEALGWRLIEEGLADLCASDHHGDYRPVAPREAARALLARGAAEQARLLLWENPRRILANEETLAVPPFPAEAAA